MIDYRRFMRESAYEANAGVFGSSSYAGKKKVSFRLNRTNYRIWVDAEGMFHREHGPAAEGEDGDKVWFWHGVSHSQLKEDGPWWGQWGWGKEN